MKAIINHEATIHDIRVLNESCEHAREEAKRLMLKGDLNRYFQKLLEISQVEEELFHSLAA